MALLDSVRQSLQHAGLVPGATMLVAVSGGADSLCLLHLLSRLRAELALQLHVAHLNHGLRAAAVADAEFVASLAADWNIPAIIATRDVAAYARRQRQGIQAAARAVRYTFLAEAARTVGADAVALAHNANDQAETVVQRLLRGAGPAGLAAMRPLSSGAEWGIERLVRPLLATPRDAIDAYCAAQGLNPRDDPSNRSAAYLRSRIRHELMPQLATYNSQVVAALNRTARICADDYDYLQSQLDLVWPDLAVVAGAAVRLDQTRLMALHPALRRYALRRAIAQLLGDGEPLDLARIEAACSAALTGVGTRLELPGGLRLAVVHGSVALSLGQLTADETAPQLLIDRLDLPATGEVALPQSRWSVRVVDGMPQPPVGRWQVVLNRERLAGPLHLRRRRPGDRLRPVGGRGSRRLQDLFVDQKIPREQRAGWPLLMAGEALVWVCGLTQDERFAADAHTTSLLWVELAHK